MAGYAACAASGDGLRARGNRGPERPAVGGSVGLERSSALSEALPGAAESTASEMTFPSLMRDWRDVLHDEFDDIGVIPEIDGR